MSNMKIYPRRSYRKRSKPDLRILYAGAYSVQCNCRLSHCRRGNGGSKAEQIHGWDYSTISSSVQSTSYGKDTVTALVVCCYNYNRVYSVQSSVQAFIVAIADSSLSR